jgi:2-oxoglutarate dehydrogenase E2 component (dihydrolipoamide succinyltransferase)
MAQEVTLPALGESVTEGTVTRWLKKVGDTVAVDEPLVEISTDKVDTEIPSPIAGVVEEILVAEDETVEVGAVLARIGDGSGVGGAPAAPAAQPEAAPVVEAPIVEAPVVVAPPAPEPAPVVAPPVAAPPVAAPAVVTPQPVVPPPVVAPPAPAPAVAPAAPAGLPQPVPSGGRSMPYVTPIVRKLANDHGVDVSRITGTGVGGRIRKEDILAATGQAGQPAPAAAPTTVAASGLRGTSVPMSRLRKVIAERAVASMQQTAQLTSVVEVDVTEIAELRTAVKDQFAATTGVKLSFLPFFVKAAAEALQVFPIINAVVDGENIVYPATENISIAVDTERGLLTPVLKSAGGMNIAQVASAISDLAERTRTNQLSPDELAGGTFTLTNTGSRGALFDTPVVFLPQVAILGTGIVQKKPVVVTHNGDDSIAIRQMVYLALSYDHRIVDGADAARFLTMVKDRLEAGDFDGDLGI